MDISEVEEHIQQDNVKEIALQFVDILGVLHSLWVPSNSFAQVAEEGIHTDAWSMLAKAT
ncbi:MAG: hypothetical protein ACXAEI_03950 [Candidatus Hodarchaeales archaeon]|jgi:glutamine synthetase